MDTLQPSTTEKKIREPLHKIGKNIIIYITDRFSLCRLEHHGGFVRGCRKWLWNRRSRWRSQRLSGKFPLTQLFPKIETQTAHKHLQVSPFSHDLVPLATKRSPKVPLVMPKNLIGSTPKWNFQYVSQNHIIYHIDLPWGQEVQSASAVEARRRGVPLEVCCQARATHRDTRCRHDRQCSGTRRWARRAWCENRSLLELYH